MELHLIDAFAAGPFTGNPAAVVWLDAVRDDRWMQQVAMEMNQAETAFLLPQESGFGLRWFTPASEVDLCGHATLASAHFLWERGTLASNQIARFHTRSGMLTAERDPDGRITLDFPAIGTRSIPQPADTFAALGVSPVECHMGLYDLLFVLENAAQVRALSPDMNAIAKWPARGVTVTAVSDVEGIDVVSRCFFPALGIPEDPVTGSAHCALAVFWQGRLGKADVTAFQASQRGGTLRCVVAGDRVRLTGRAVTTLVGALRV